MGKIIITGPGRSGTTFLVQLLTRLGYDTGYEPYKEPYYHSLRAGCEQIINVDLDRTDEEIRQAIDEAPQVLKSPEWGLMLKRLLAKKLIEVDHVFIPIRDLEEAARSRLDVGLDWLVADSYPTEEDKILDQANVKAMALGRAIEACVMYDLSYTIVRYPDFIKDYACSELELYFWVYPIRRRVSQRKFREAWQSLQRKNDE